MRSRVIGWPTAATIFPGWAALFTLYYDGDVVNDRRIRFLETNPLVLEYAQKGRRSRDLILSPPTPG